MNVKQMVGVYALFAIFIVIALLIGTVPPPAMYNGRRTHCVLTWSSHCHGKMFSRFWWWRPKQLFWFISDSAGITSQKYTDLCHSMHKSSTRLKLTSSNAILVFSLSFVFCSTLQWVETTSAKLNSNSKSERRIKYVAITLE